MRASTLGATFALVMTIGAGALADSQTNAAVAESLFRDAKVLLAKGQTAPACRKLEESERLDPGGGTLLSLALCHEKEGKTATAWSEFQASVALAHTSHRGDRERVATAHAAALQPKLSRLVVDVSAPADIAGLEVRVDDVVIGKPAWGSNLPIDPGPHKIRVTAPDHDAWSTDVDVGANTDLRTIPVPPLVAHAQLQTKTETPPPSAGLVARRNAGIAVGAVGILGIGIGAAFGIRAFSKNSDSKVDCSNGICNQSGFDAYQSGKTAATISDIGFGAGVVLAAVGGYLLFTSRTPAMAKESARRSIHVSASASPSHVALGLGGSF